MQSTVIAFSAIFVVLIGLAVSSDVLPLHRERRAPSTDLEGFGADGWDEAQETGLDEDFRTGEFAKRIADNDFAAMRHQEKSNSLRRSRLLQAMNEMLAMAGKRSVTEKRSLAQNDFMMAKHELAQGKLYRSLLDRLLTEAGKR